MKPIIFAKAGKLAIFKYASDGSLSLVAGNLASKAAGAVQAIRPSINIQTSELADGNSDWPVGVYDTGKSGQVEITFSEFQPDVYAALIGSAALATAANKDLWEIEEEGAIPTNGTYEVTLAETPKTGGTIIVVNNEGSPFTKVASSPAVGEYSVTGNKLTFNSLDAGKEVFVTYEWTATSADSMALPRSGSRPILHAIISGEATDDDQVTTYRTNIIIDKCKATGDLNPPPRQREVQPWTATLQVLKPRAGKNAVDFVFAKR